MSEETRSTSRRSLWAMLGGIGIAYAWFGSLAARFLLPGDRGSRSWQFVTLADRVSEGDSLLYEAPGGETINVARTGSRGDASDFIALSSVCPHLGCQVYWQGQQGRFFCPCHNGVFDKSGVAFGGPPAEAGQSLSRYPVRLDRGRLFIEVSTGTTLARGRVIERDRAPRGPGHDPILAGNFHPRECGRTPEA